MSGIKKLTLAISLIFFTPMEAPVCKKCEEIREYNRTHPENTEYYEDYCKVKNIDKEGTTETEKKAQPDENEKKIPENTPKVKKLDSTPKSF